MNPNFFLPNISQYLPNISSEMSNRLLKYDMSKTDHLISPLKPVSLPLFSNFVNTNTIHPLTQVPNLRVILNSCFSYTPVNLWTSPIISCHHDRALICPLLINSAIIIPGPVSITLLTPTSLIHRITKINGSQIILTGFVVWIRMIKIKVSLLKWGFVL